MRMIVPILVGTLLTFSACGGKNYNVAAWQEASLASTNAQASALTDEEQLAAAIDAKRASLDLASARTIALDAAARYPENAELLWRAARSESDSVFLHGGEQKEERSLSALSSLEYSRRAVAASPESAAALAELGWSMGTTTHLQPMMKRSGHARETRAIIDQALAAEPDNPRATATDALLQLRLCTLPWIANVMPSKKPPASLEGAEASARKAISLEASRENRLILAKILATQKRVGEARQVAQEAVDAPPTFPRDAEYHDDLVEFLSTHPDEAK